MEAASAYRDLGEAYLDGFGGDVILGGLSMGDRSTHDSFSTDLVAQRMKVDRDFPGSLAPWDTLERSDYYLFENRGRRMNCAGTRYLQILGQERLPFPEYYRSIPWASIGVPVSRPRGIRRLGKGLQRLGLGRQGQTRAGSSTGSCATRRHCIRSTLPGTRHSASGMSFSAVWTGPTRSAGGSPWRCGCSRCTRVASAPARHTRRT